VTATDGISETPGGVWQFTTWNHGPDVPTLIAPPDGAIKVPLTQTLRWSSEDADGDLITYSVAFGTADPPPIAATTTLTQYAPALQPLTTYYWAITATDGISDSRGPVWRLSTDSEYALYLPLAVSNK
jgi:hypothetical protein